MKLSLFLLLAVCAVFAQGSQSAPEEPKDKGDEAGEPNDKGADGGSGEGDGDGKQDNLNTEQERLTVLSLVQRPFVQTDRQGDYEGLVIDLIQQFSDFLDRPLSLKLSSDGQYGMNDKGEWNGLVGDLLRGEGDIIMADITITDKRQEVIEFSLPYFNAPLSVLRLKPRNYDESCPSKAAGIDDILEGIYSGRNVKIASAGGIIDHVFEDSSYNKLQTLGNYLDLDQYRLEVDNVDDFVRYVRENQDFDAYFIHEMPYSAVRADTQPCDLLVTKLLGGSFQPENQFGFAVKKGNEELLRMANTFIQKLSASGELMHLEQKWFNKQC